VNYLGFLRGGDAGAEVRRQCSGPVPRSASIKGGEAGARLLDALRSSSWP
jgi:hypothetical protein